jgi:hypothetical protein
MKKNEEKDERENEGCSRLEFTRPTRREALIGIGASRDRTLL